VGDGLPHFTLPIFLLLLVQTPPTVERTLQQLPLPQLGSAHHFFLELQLCLTGAFAQADKIDPSTVRSCHNLEGRMCTPVHGNQTLLERLGVVVSSVSLRSGFGKIL
jgi:hypothetical protein